MACSCYLSKADINMYAFIPGGSSKIQSAEISSFGQKVFKVRGDYHKAKTLAKSFAEKNPQ